MSTTATNAPEAPPGAAAWIPSRIHRMTVEEYEWMVARGVIPSRNRFHLINGYVVEKMTRNPPHAVSFQRCGGELARVAPHG